jgi:hypothetical protein
MLFIFLLAEVLSSKKMGKDKFPLHRIIIIYPEIKRKFKINSDQYSVIESVRILSSKEEWCTQKKELIGEFCQVSRASVFRAINLAKRKDLIISHPEHEDWIRTTQEWNELVLGLKTIWREEKKGSETDSLKLRLEAQLQEESQIETVDLNKQSQSETTESQSETDEFQNEIKQSQNETPNKLNNTDNVDNISSQKIFQNPEEEDLAAKIEEVKAYYEQNDILNEKEKAEAIQITIETLKMTLRNPIKTEGET